MSAVKWTAGWEVVNSETPCIKIIRGPSFHVHAVMWATDLDESDYRRRLAELNLMAASPDMADALRQWQHAEETGDKAELENARVARGMSLAKARGES